MKLSIAIFAIATAIVFSNESHSQDIPLQPVNTNLDSLQKVKTDSIQRSWMKDSLSLSDATISQVFNIRDSSIVRTEKINADSTLFQWEKSDMVQAERKVSLESIQSLLGDVMFQRYLDMIVGRRRNY